MEAQLRLLQADQRRRVGIAEDGEQAEVAQRAVRKAGSGDGEVSLREEELDRPALHADVEVLHALVQVAQLLDDGALRLRVAAELVEEEAQVREVLLQAVTPRVR